VLNVDNCIAVRDDDGVVTLYSPRGFDSLTVAQLTFLSSNGYHTTQHRS
jgi:hypothetical protein